MIPLPVALPAIVLAGVAGHLAARYDLAAWVLHLYARALGAWWFTPRYACPKCGREVHLVRSRPDRAGIFGAKDGGGRCLSCSGTKPRNAPQDAPERTESAGDAGLGVLGWPGTPRDTTGPHRQDRTDERNGQ